MSCRVQRKKVENALLGHLQELAIASNANGIQVCYGASKRNAPALEILSEMHFRRTQSDEGEEIFVVTKEIPDRDIVMVEDHTKSLKTLTIVG